VKPVPGNGSNEQFKYWAFISYSHADMRWGDWLHKKLEGYRVPRSLAGKPSRDGKVPRRLFPIFRDREELPVSADLGATIALPGCDLLAGGRTVALGKRRGPLLQEALR